MTYSGKHITKSIMSDEIIFLNNTSQSIIACHINDRKKNILNISAGQRVWFSQMKQDILIGMSWKRYSHYTLMSGIAMYIFYTSLYISQTIFIDPIPISHGCMISIDNCTTVGIKK